MRVKEWQGDVVFLHEVAPGAADRSYGIHVGRLAGLPGAVIERAEEVLAALEAGEQGGAAARLQQSALHGEPRIWRCIQQGNHGCDFVAFQIFRVDAVHPHDVAPTFIRVALGVGMGQIEDAALGKHDVEIQILAQPLPQFQ